MAYHEVSADALAAVVFGLFVKLTKPLLPGDAFLTALQPVGVSSQILWSRRLVWHRAIRRCPATIDTVQLRLVIMQVALCKIYFSHQEEQHHDLT